MANAYADPLTVELNEYLLRTYSAHDTRVVYERIDEYSEPELGPYVGDLDLPNTLLEALEKRGIRRLYKFQYEAYRNIISGRNVVIVSGTGTGKTEAFYIPLAKRVIEEEKPNPRAMLLYPTKALARDQVNRFREYNVYGKLGIGIYDGDTPKRLRSRTASSPPPILVSNPDMIHLGLIYSQHIRRFIDSSDVLVFDELHNYEGVLGSHLHHLVRRIKLTRSKETQFIVSSATIGNPKEFAGSIFDEDFVEIRGEIKRKGVAVHAFVSSGLTSRWVIVSAISRFLAERGLKFIIFADSQQLAELLASVIETKFNVRTAVHRAGLPAEVRRDVEHKLRSGALQGVVATPTLELGVDIGSLDVVLLATLPPSFAKYLQRAGRAGRRRKGYIITVLGDDPIDSYFLRQPAKFFDQELTPSAIEPFNEEVIKAHLVAMLLQVGKENISNLPHHWRAVVNDLLAENVIKKIDQYVAVVYRIGHKYLAERGSIRSLGEVVEVVDSERGDVIATRELPLALLELYPGSIYICSKTPFRVIQFDAVNKKAVVKRLEKDQGLYTRPLYTVNVVGCAVHSERTTDIGLRARYAKVLLELLVDGYIVKSTYSGEVVSTVALEKPIKYRYTTRATLIKFPSPLTFTYRDSAEAFHAVEHSLISAARILCGASLTDLGGISYPSGDMVIYDSLIGGSGVSKLLYDKLDSAVITAREIMRRCKCSNGCPHCIYSPYCGNNNKVLSKKKATQVLDRLISRRQPIELYPLENRYGKPIA